MGSAQLMWRKGSFTNGVIGFNQFLGPEQTTYSVAYAVSYVKVDEALNGLHLEIGSDDQSKVYLNGRLIYEHRFGRTFTDAPDVLAEINLEKGLNVVVFKVVNEISGWKGSMRFITTG